MFVHFYTWEKNLEVIYYYSIYECIQETRNSCLNTLFFWSNVANVKIYPFAYGSISTASCPSREIFGGYTFYSIEDLL